MLPLYILVLGLLVVVILPLCAAYSPVYGISSGLGKTIDASTRLSSSAESAAMETCMSNSTHIGWPSMYSEGGQKGCTYQTWSNAVRDCLSYLRSNLMPFDVPNAGTLGFPTAITSEVATVDEDMIRVERKLSEDGQQEIGLDELPDGLDDGIINRTIHLALSTKVHYPWTARIPRDIFYEYVLSFCATNEARTNWRPLLTEALEPILKQLKNNATIEMVVETINRHLWTVLAKDPLKPIYFKTGQTPLIFDPMSIVAFGYGSCTGLSILLVFALRSAGIPARLVGTPAWWGIPEEGNHNWVEVWTPCDSEKEEECGGRWRFLEPAMGDYGGDVDNLDRDPCKRWFCTKDRFNGTTKVYAARYDRGGGTVYPLAWDLANKDVPGVDRTSYYEEVCGQCT